MLFFNCFSGQQQQPPDGKVVKNGSSQKGGGGGAQTAASTTTTADRLPAEPDHPLTAVRAHHARELAAQPEDGREREARDCGARAVGSDFCAHETGATGPFGVVKPTGLFGQPATSAHARCNFDGMYAFGTYLTLTMKYFPYSKEIFHFPSIRY